uniref:Uncharacterized protein n=1 Tax=Oryza brachyantha TaxID=4533 RepID=J3MJM9_ORYBR
MAGSAVFSPSPCLTLSSTAFKLMLYLWLGFVTMGLFRTSFTLLVGMGCGVYVAQNYNVPNVKRLFNTYMFLAKHIEETYRKPKRDDD